MNKHQNIGNLRHHVQALMQYRPFSHCIDQAGLGAFTAKSGRKHYNQGRSQRGGVGGCDTPPIIRPVGKIRVLWAKLRRKEREEKERGARKKEKERKKNWRKEKDKERKEKRRKKERKRRKIERKKKRGYAYVIMQAKIDSVDKCRHLQVSLL